MTQPIDIIVTGHICLDLIPALGAITPEMLALPGRLLETGPMSVSTGGAVSNTGLALHRLGANVRLLATVGDDLIGRVIIAFLKDRDPALTEFMHVKPNQPGSYSVVLSPKNGDRTFLHCPANNSTFSTEDIDFEVVAQGKIFHLGYPTILPRLIENDGDALAAIYQQAKAVGAATSLDMTLPDPASPSGRADWKAILAKTLPYVDIFLPSIEEILFMLRRDDYERWHGNVLSHLTRAYLRDFADELLVMGVVIAGFKLGEMGIYLRNAESAKFDRLARLGLNVPQWADAEVYLPAFQAEVVGTTGAGDSAYAGFLVGIVRGMSPENAVRLACGVGACNVEAPDATSGVQSLEATEARIHAGWPTRTERLPDFRRGRT